MKRLLVVLLFTAAFAALFAYGVFTPRNERDVASPRLDKEVLDFEVEAFSRYLDGYSSTLRLSDYEGKPRVVNFWASWCYPACYREAPHLEAVWRRYEGRVAFIGIAYRDGDERAEAFLDEFNLSFPSGKDAQGRVGIDYGILGLPETFFIRADGTLSYRHIGEISKEKLIEEIEAMLR